MVIYVDILIIVSFAVDYFLLKAAAALIKRPVPLWRMILSSFLSALFSLYIFLPRQNVLLQILFRAAVCAAVTAAAFGIRGIKAYLRAVAAFFGVTAAYAGGMAAVYTLFRPSGMAVKNSVVYFNISPLALILSAAAFYIILRTADLLLARYGARGKCEVTLYIGGRNKRFAGLADTGNALRDPFCQSEIIIVNEVDIKPLMTAAGEDEKTRFCLLPCKTVTGSGLLKGYRLDRASVTTEKGEFFLTKPVAAFSAVPIERDTAIINPQIFE